MSRLRISEQMETSPPIEGKQAAEDLSKTDEKNNKLSYKESDYSDSDRSKRQFNDSENDAHPKLDGNALHLNKAKETDDVKDAEAREAKDATPDNAHTNKLIPTEKDSRIERPQSEKPNQNELGNSEQKKLKGAEQEDPEIKDLDDPEYKKRYDRTPRNNGIWVDENGNPGRRGESKFIPDNPEIQEKLSDNGIDGIEYKNCYPDFSPISKFNVYLEPEDYLASDAKQFEMCNEALADAVLPDLDTGEIECPEIAARFTDDQLADISVGDTPEGYTWNHDVKEGHMQLVPTDIHQTCRHAGGRSLWGGGAEFR